MAKKSLNALLRFIFVFVLALLVLTCSNRLTADQKGFLTAADRAWLDAHPQITLAYEANYAPFTFVDKAGRVRGISVDYIKLVERELGIKFRLVSVDSLDVNLKMAREGKADVLTSLMRTHERSRFLKFTKPYVSVPAVMIVRRSYSGPTALSEMTGRLVAVGKGYAVESFIERRYPHLALVKTADDVAALKKLAFGEVDAAVVDIASASSIIGGQGITNLKLSGPVGFNYDLSMASRSDLPELNRILEGALGQISPVEKNTIYRKWVQLDQPLPLWIKASGLTGAALLVAGLMIVLFEVGWNRKLKREVTLRTCELEEQLEELRKTERELKNSEFRFNTIAFNISEIFWIAAPDWSRIDYVSPAFESIWGRSPSTIYANPDLWLEDVLSDDRAAVESEIKGNGALSRNQVEAVEFRIKRPDGFIRWIRARVYPIFNADGKLAQITGIAEDITDIKHLEAEQAVIAGTAKLLQQNRPELYSELAGLIGHHLRFPLVLVEFNVPGCDVVRLAGGLGLDAHLEGRQIPSSQSVASAVMAEGHVLSVVGEAAARIASLSVELESYSIKALICAPVSVGNEILGAIVVADECYRSDVEAWRPILQTVAAFLGHEIGRRQTLESLRLSEQRFRAIADYTYDWESWVGADGRLIWVSPSVERLTGYTVNECFEFADYPLPLVHTEDRDGLTPIFSGVQPLTSGNNHEFRIKKRDGRLVWGAVSWQPVFGASGDYLGIRTSVRDITERHVAEETMGLRLHLLQFAATHSLDQIMTETLDCVGRMIESPIGFFHFLDVDQQTLTLQTWSSNTLATMCQADGKGSHYNVADAGVWVDCVRERRAVVHNDYASLPHRKGMPDGHAPVVRELVVPIFRGELIVAILGLGNKPQNYDDEDLEFVTQIASLTWDIVEKKRTEDERASLETQLQQAQKMESVGRLAGGVAHDFNNMLMVIIGHAELAMSTLSAGAPLLDELRQIRSAAQRSADLTAQLLAFARQQPVTPRVLNLNQAVDGMSKMLRRLIGEDIDLIWKPGDKLWLVKIDPTQVDQILANLVVNARDAISGVGSISIETRNVLLDDHYCVQHVGCVPGEYVMLSVNDTGRGMDSETVQHIFEPFFTTKAAGKGTGLGLSMVYGAIHQNDGFINVYSEPGLGTSFTVYLPRSDERRDAELITETAAKPQRLTGSETVLLVEDEAALLDLSRTVLEAQGYRVLTAQSPISALKIIAEYSGPLDLLITDVVMPEMNGRELTKAVMAAKPEVKALFMSGYPAEVIAHHGVIEEGVSFLQKPFSAKAFATKVREVLDG